MDLKVIQAVLTVVQSSSESKAIICIAVLLAIATVVLIYRVARLKPEKVTSWDKAVVLLFLGATLLLTASGLAVGFIDARASVAIENGVPPDVVLENLQNNARVTWLIRLIPYRPGTSDDLNVDSLQYLGLKGQQYTFVADYDELKGDRVSDAISKVGGSLEPNEHVSAIIFPLNGRPLFPASARGLLQVVAILDGEPQATGAVYRPFAEMKDIGTDAQKDLGDRDISSWSWASYGPRFYEQYCHLAQDLRCSQDQFTALSFIGGLNSDWDPLGFSFRVPPRAVCSTPEKEAQCSITSWTGSRQYIGAIGVRAFLVQNVSLASLENRRLIDFADPANQVIPVFPEKGSQ